MYLLTRPLPKLNDSVAAFQQAGLHVCGIATTDIAEHSEGVAALSDFLRAGIVPDHLIITSVFAARALIDLFSRYPQSHVHLQSVNVVAVGFATATELSPWFSHIAVPRPQTSEGIVMMPEFNRANCQHIVIIKGIGGRSAIRDRLREKQHTVDTFDVYRRTQLDKPVICGDLTSAALTGVIATSEEQALTLLATASLPAIASLPWLTVSDRIASTLRNKGIDQVGVSGSASDNALINWIEKNWE